MKKYHVELPIYGYLTVQVEVPDDADEDDAIAAALEAEYTIDNVTDWEVSEYVARGEVNYVVMRRGNAEECVTVEGE